MPRQTYDVVVVGAGIIGLACAYSISRSGASVCVLEQHLPGSGDSTRTGGGIRLAHGSRINIELTKLSLPTWEHFESAFGVDPRFRQTGHLFLTANSERAAALEAQVREHARCGVESKILGLRAIKQRWPPLQALDFATGSYCATGGYLDHHCVISGYQQAVQKGGAVVCPGVRVEGIIRQGARVCGVRTSVGEVHANVVVNAGGAAAGIIASFAGLSLPFRSRRHELLIVRPTAPVPENLPWLIDLDAQVHLRPDGQGRALIGGFLGRDEPSDPQHHSREYSTGWADEARLTAAHSFGLTRPDVEIVEGWAGLYPGTVDYLPVVEASQPGFITAAGFSGTGLMHAPAIGMIVNTIIEGKTLDEINISSLSSARFKTHSKVAEVTGF